MSQNPAIGWQKHLLYKHVSNKFVLPKNLTAEKLIRYAQARRKKLYQANKNIPINNSRDLAANPKTAVEVTKNTSENTNINTNSEEPEIVEKMTSKSGELYKKMMEDSKDHSAESKYMFQ